MSQSRKYSTLMVTQIQHPLLLQSHSMVMLLMEMRKLLTSLTDEKKVLCAHVHSHLDSHSNYFLQDHLPVAVSSICLSPNVFPDQQYCLAEQAIWDRLDDLLTVNADHLYMFVGAGTTEVAFSFVPGSVLDMYNCIGAAMAGGSRKLSPGVSNEESLIRDACDKTNASLEKLMVSSTVGETSATSVPVARTPSDEEETASVASNQVSVCFVFSCFCGLLCLY